MLRDQLINGDRYLTGDVPLQRGPDEPADWLTLRADDGAPAIVGVNHRDALICATSATWTDAELIDALDALRMAGWEGLTGWRGCPAETVIAARAAGAMIILDAPIRCIWHWIGVSLTGE